MQGLAVHRDRMAPTASVASAVSAVIVAEHDRDAALVAIPRPEIQLVVRYGPSALRGLDVYAFGVQQRAHRKIIRAGQRTVVVRLHLGASEAVLGVSAAAIAGRIAPLGELWGEVATRRLLDRLAAARATTDAAAIMERAIAERLATASPRRTQSQLALQAADRLATANVNTVADELGVSARHLRREFRETVGMGPKAFAKLARFHRALSAARAAGHASWASIAAACGYYDQAHLIAEFRAIAGATPSALVGELASLSA